jgi:flagellar basal body-associated protein FliL
MANEKEQDKTESVKVKSPSGKGGFFIWLILGAVVVAGATGGFALSQLMGGTGVVAEVNAPAEQAPPEVFDPIKAVQPGQKSWVYDKMDPIVANLDEPGVTRYVRVTVMLEMSPQMDPTSGAIFLDEKKVVLQDWMTTYLAGLSLEDVRGSRNLTRIKKEVLDQFNQILFDQGKPFAERVLFKEFAVQ